MTQGSYSLLFNSISYPDKNAHVWCKNLIEKYFKKIKFKTVVEIGGSISKNASSFFNCNEYYNLDLINNPNVPTIVCDCTKKIPLPTESVDFVFSNDAFEHLENPFATAEEIQRILIRGGLVFIGTLFSWRYHPVPEDYFRFSPSGLKALFPKINVIEANFVDSWRRDDIRGFWKSKRDSVPIDMLGGWRENWKVFYFGQKPMEA